ncbi:MAG: ABC transporter permease [Deltaproteobacteria bacterium]|nr:ABC transporter permease [Deltaproteobacteria bacterium]
MNTGTLAAMAWRNIWRNRRRTLVTLASIVFGTFLAVFLTGMGDATYGKMIDTAAKMGNGHVTVQHRLQTEAPAPKRFVSGAKGLAAQVVQTPGVRGAAARIMATAMVAAGGESRGAALIGIDVGSESKESLAALGGVAEGALFAADDKHGALLGADLARHLGVELGSKVVFTLTDRNGEIVTALLRVRGLLQTGSPDADSGLVIAPLQTLQKALGYGPEDATLVAVLVEDQRQTASVARALQPLQSGDRVVRTWHETMPELSGFIDMKLSGAAFMQGLVLLLVAAGIFNALLVSVMERMREFGILSAIGWGRGLLFGLVMLESLWIGLCGLLATVLVAAWPYWKLSTEGFTLPVVDSSQQTQVANVMMDPTFYVRIHPENLALIVVAVLTATLLSGLLPAWIAGRVNPTTAIKLV